MQSGGSSQSLKENATWEKLRNMHRPVPIMHEPCSLSISTRGIGLVLAEIVPQLTIACTQYDSDDDEWSYKPDIPIASMYRASLAQLEAKMYFGRENQSGPFSVRSATESSLFGPPKAFYESLTWNNKNVGPIAYIINSIGHVEVNGKHFEPIFLSKPSPLNIRITNLRKYCEDMSNLKTDSSERVNGYKLNSIPNAKWERKNVEDPQSVYLTNPNEIIPPNYNDASIINDLWKLEDLISKISPENHHFRGTIEYKKCGDPGILASTQVVPGKSMSLNGTTNIITEYSDIEFWSREPIEPLSWAIGAISLAGEILDPTIPSQRSRSFAIQTNSVAWGHAVGSLTRMHPSEN